MKNYGIGAKFHNIYLVMCDVIKIIYLTVTLLLIPCYVGTIVYYTFVDFNPVKAIVFGAVLWVMVDTNAKS